jgi:hypothetical protein
MVLTAARLAAEAGIADAEERVLCVAHSEVDPPLAAEETQFVLRIARLRESERLSAQNCAELREHLCGCGPLPAGA